MHATHHGRHRDAIVEHGGRPVVARFAGRDVFVATRRRGSDGACASFSFAHLVPEPDHYDYVFRLSNRYTLTTTI